jgi:cation diffusion facilitator family transporter
MSLPRSYHRGQPVLIFGGIGNALLAVGKIAVGLAAHSAALLADGVHSAVDLGGLLAAWVGFFVSGQPADEAHPYGHQKAESVAEKIVAILLILAGFQIFVGAVSDLRTPKLQPPLMVAFWVALLATLLKLVLYVVTRRTARALRSAALKATAADHATDVWSGLAAVVGIGLARLGVPAADPIAAMGVSLVVVWTGWRLVVEAVDSLMDRFDDQELLAEVARTATAVPGVAGVAGLRGRPMGADALIDIEILVAGDLSVREGHAIARRVRLAVEAAHPRVKGVHIHVNPYPEGAGVAEAEVGSREG